MSDLPLFDADHLDLQTAGDTELKAELVALFRQQCAALLPAIVDEGGNAAARADLAHTLKGSALGIGAARLAAAAGAAELDLLSGELLSADRTRSFADQVAQTLAALPG